MNAETRKQYRRRFNKLVAWADARYQPVRGDTSLNTRTYNAIVVAAIHRYSDPCAVVG